MKKEELARAVEVLEKSNDFPELVAMLKDICSINTSQEVDLINRPDYFASVLWQDSDLEAALNANKIEVNEENLGRLKAETKSSLEDSSSGWDIIMDASNDML